MYESFYGFAGSPFKLTPDANFFYGSQGHMRALAHLTFGLSQGEGFVVITGEVGAGKTTLVERLSSQLDHNTHTLVRLNTTQVSGDDLLRLVVAGLRVEVSGNNKASLLLGFEDIIRTHRLSGRRCVLAVDEAQGLSLSALEELRVLSNLTDERGASLQTILLGQPDFRRMLASPELEQLRQRVLASYHLSPLDASETQAYVEHRLTAVGWSGAPQIKNAAFDAVHRHSGGIPRRINRLCARVLLYGALEKTWTVTAEMVNAIALELNEDLDGVSSPPMDCAGDETEIRNGQQSAFYNSYSKVQADLVERVANLEARMDRREQLFRRLYDALGRLK